MPDSGRGLVLIVDDSFEMREACAAVCRIGGYEVALAASARAGFERAERLRPDVIVLDLVLPDSSGAELARQLRESGRTAAIPIIAISGMGGWDVPEASRFLAKPFAPRVLLDEIGLLLASAAPRDGDPFRRDQRLS